MYLVSKENYFSNELFNKLKNRYNMFEFINTKKKLEHCMNNNSLSSKFFFFHWPYIVKKDIVDNYECINIHTSNLPYGKGGSPIQNQIMDNIITTKVNALRMTEEIDGGPIYCYRTISLQGSLFDIWLTIYNVTFDIICEIIDNKINPIYQKKIENETIYRRRRNNEIPFEDDVNLETIYNFIRMLDSENYPNPNIKIGKYSLEFSRGKFDGNQILCDVTIKYI